MCNHCVCEQEINNLTFHRNFCSYRFYSNTVLVLRRHIHEQKKSMIYMHKMKFESRALSGKPNRSQKRWFVVVVDWQADRHYCDFGAEIDRNSPRIWAHSAIYQPRHCRLWSEFPSKARESAYGLGGRGTRHASDYVSEMPYHEPFEIYFYEFCHCNGIVSEKRLHLFISWCILINYYM